MLLYGLVSAFRNQNERAQHGETARRILAHSGVNWAVDFVDQQSYYDGWLNRWGLPLDAFFFEQISYGLFRSAVQLGSVQESLSFIERQYVALHFAVLRISFILLACWKLWLLVVVYAGWSMHKRLVPYRGPDFLGQTGNSRLFYSGIRAGLDDVDERGLPGLQVIGLACPSSVSPAQARTSALWRVLENYGAANDTNLGLIGVIEQHVEWPAYISEREHAGVLQAAFAGGNLVENTQCLVEAVLALHARYVRGEAATSARKNETGALAKVSSAEYAEKVGEVMDQVLTSEWKGEIADISPALIATLVLALEAGKVMTYAFEGGRWLRRSAFLQLNARAVLHSMEAFGREYNGEERELIRKSLVFSSRRSVFAPVRLPVDLSPACRALRQWAEVLLACPHEIVAISHEVELVSLVTEAHQRWEMQFFDGLNKVGGDLASNLVSTQTNLFLLPLGTLMKVLGSVVKPADVRRIEALVTLVSQGQKLENLSQDLTEEAAERAARGIQDRIHAPLSFQEMKDISSQHGLPLEMVRDWSALRVVLNSYGWLARRVGDYSVPPSSVIFTVLKPEQSTAECNSLGLMGRSGMVPFRTSQIQERIGRSWSARFFKVSKATMAETKERMNELLKGAPESSIDGESSDPGTSSSFQAR